MGLDHGRPRNRTTRERLAPAAAASRPIAAARSTGGRPAGGGGRPALERVRAAVAAEKAAKPSACWSICLGAFADASRRPVAAPRASRRARPQRGGRGAAQADRAPRSQQPRRDPGARAETVQQGRARARPRRHARNAVRIAPLDAQSHNLMGMIMTEAQRPQVGEHHYRRAGELLPEPSAHPDRQSRLEPEEPGADGGVAGALRRVGRARPEHLPDPFRLGADGGDRSQFRPRRRNCSTRRRSCRPATPTCCCNARSCTAAVKDYDKAVATLDEIERRRGGGARSAGVEREGSAARQDGATRRGVRRLQRSQADFARTHRPGLSRGGGGGAGAASDRVLRRRPAENPAARRRSRRRRPADLRRRLSPLRHDDDRADA